MKYLKELGRDTIIADLLNYYEEDQLSNYSDEYLEEFFSNHINANAKELKISEIFNVHEKILVNSLDGYVLITDKVIKENLDCFTVTLKNGAKISCSYNHLVETKDGWKKIIDLTKKDLILTSDGFIYFKNKRKLKNQTVYDFQVNHPNHRYLTASGISSHNTGKTYIACAEALRLLIAPTSTFKKIVIVKSVTVLEGEDIGYLKGNMKEKMEPFMNSFMDNFYKIIGKENSVALLASEIIEILPLAYIRGRSIDEAIIIIDESQNMPKHHLKSTVTRIGEKSKMIFLADEDQVDLKNKKDSGLTWFLDVTADLDEFGTMRFTKDDVVRNPLISKFLKHIEEKESTQNSI